MSPLSLWKAFRSARRAFTFRAFCETPKFIFLVERAPRDVVARAIVHEMEISRAKDPFVYLDVTHINANKIQKSFSRVYGACMAYNIDITEDLIPVRPAANAAETAGRAAPGSQLLAETVHRR